MMNAMTLGRYYPANSLIHNLDPRAKILALILLLTAVFYPAGFQGYLVVGTIVLVAVIWSKIPFSYFLMGFKPLTMMLVFLLVINIFVIKSGELLWQYSSFSLYSGALIQTSYIVVRLALMVTVTTLLTATTKPLDLTLGIEDLLKPFKILGLPTHEISMMISIALRFIPTILDEAIRIMKAQQSRGVDWQEGKLKEKIMAILSLIIPLFICAFQRAEELANAMEARGYDPSAQRTRFHQLKIAFRDIVMLVLCSGALVAVIMLGLSQ